MHAGLTALDSTSSTVNFKMIECLCPFYISTERLTLSKLHVCCTTLAVMTYKGWVVLASQMSRENKKGGGGVVSWNLCNPEFLGSV